jgi:hypothetical protein
MGWVHNSSRQAVCGQHFFPRHARLTGYKAGLHSKASLGAQHTCDRAPPAGNAATNECYQHRVSDRCKHSWCPETTPARLPATHSKFRHTRGCSWEEVQWALGDSARDQVGVSAGDMGLQATQQCHPMATSCHSQPCKLSRKSISAAPSKHTRGCAAMLAALEGNRRSCRLSAGQAHIGCVDPVGAGDGVMVNTCNNTE